MEKYLGDFFSGIFLFKILLLPIELINIDFFWKDRQFIHLGCMQLYEYTYVVDNGEYTTVGGVLHVEIYYYTLVWFWTANLAKSYTLAI